MSDTPETIGRVLDRRYQAALDLCEQYKLERDKLRAINAELIREMERYLQIIERAELCSSFWDDFLAQGTGIATANGYRHVLAKAKQQ